MFAQRGGTAFSAEARACDKHGKKQTSLIESATSLTNNQKNTFCGSTN